MKPALLIVDMQKGFLQDKITSPKLDEALEYINAACDLFEKQNLPVVFVQDEDAKEEPGENSFELMDSIDRNFTVSKRVSKKYCNSFWQTSLEEDLRSWNADFLVITGFAAETCINPN